MRSRSSAFGRTAGSARSFASRFSFCFSGSAASLRRFCQNNFSDLACKKPLVLTTIKFRYLMSIRIFFYDFVIFSRRQDEDKHIIYSTIRRRMRTSTCTCITVYTSKCTAVLILLFEYTYCIAVCI